MFLQLASFSLSGCWLLLANKINEANIINPPIISSFDIASDKINQTQTGPKTLSTRTSKLTSAAGTNGVPVVTKVIPNHIVNAPINKDKLRSYDEIINP